MTLRLLQVCNVGQIIGGTAACAWTVTRAIPAFAHTVAFLSRPTTDTIEAFAPCRVLHWKHVTAENIAAARPDLILLHNTARRHLDRLPPVPTIQYLHSRIAPAPADLTLYCSRWLAEQDAADPRNVCWQAVPRPHDAQQPHAIRALRKSPVIGRLCTPVAKKWPGHLPDFYARLARRFPQVRWEFVGCPADLVPLLRTACGPETAFVPASWHARSRLWSWTALLYHNPALSESFGRTVAEAMRAGCIPVVDDQGGFHEQINESTGFLCSDLDAFAAAIESVLNPAERLRRSRACRAHADEHFSLHRFARDLLTRFEQAAAVRTCGVQKRG